MNPFQYLMSRRDVLIKTITLRVLKIIRKECDHGELDSSILGFDFNAMLPAFVDHILDIKIRDSVIVQMIMKSIDILNARVLG